MLVRLVLIFVRRQSFAVAVVVTSFLSTSVTAENWGRFRGDNSDGVAQSECPTNWDTTQDEMKNVAWKVPIEGEGWSSPIIWGDQVFLTSAVPIAESP
ncbi:MAG: hypothetical protein AAF989_09430, partial [Planctomycetota bacterium]